MNKKCAAVLSSASIIQMVALGVSIHADVRAGRAEHQAANLQQDSETDAQMGRERQGVDEFAVDARRFGVYRHGSDVHVENRSDGPARHIYITWPAAGSGRSVVQSVPDLPKCYGYVLPAQGAVATRADEVPNMYWTDLGGLPWVQDNGYLVNPLNAHSTDVKEPQQPTGATFVNLTAQHVSDC